MTLRRRVVLAAFWIPLAICVIVACSPETAVPGPRIGGTLAHVAAFTYLAWVLFPAHFPAIPAADSAGSSDTRRFLAVALWMLAFGVVIEVLQVFVAGRHGTAMDLLPDAAGIALGCAAYASLRGKLRPRADSAARRAATT